MSFSEWERKPLKDIINFNPRESIEKGKECKKIGMSELNPFEKKIQGYEISEYKSGTKFRNGDTLFARITPCLENGKTAKVDILDEDEVGFGSTEFIVMRNKDGLSDEDFVYYLAISPFFRNMAIKTMTGTSGRQRAQKDVIKKTVLEIPELKEQKAIANILSTLDEKIEANNKINKNLEEMAQAIFKHWFVDFEFPNEEGQPYKSSGGKMVESELGMIPEGWEVKKLKDTIQYIKDSTKKGEHLKNRKYNPINTLPKKSVIIKEYESYKEAKSSLILFNKYDILIGAMRVYFHRVNIAPYDGITRTTTFVLRSKNKIDISFNLFLLNQKDVIDYAEKTSKGTTMPYAVWDNGLDNYKLAYPDKNLIESYHKAMFPLINNMIKNSRENEILSNLRDTLLPKLMSGEIRVPLEEDEMEEKVAQA